MHGRPQRGQQPLELRNLRAPVDCAAVPPVAVGGDEDDRGELAEPGGCPGRPVVQRARRPHRADARAGEERDDRLGDVRQVAGYPVARLDAEAAQRCGECSYRGPQLRPGEGGRLAELVNRGDGDGLGAGRVESVAQRVAGVVDARPGEPRRPWHARVGEDTAGVKAEVEEVRDAPPERVEVPHRPRKQVVVRAKVEPGPPACRGREPGNGGLGRPGGVGSPDRPGAGCGGHRGEWAPVIVTGALTAAIRSRNTWSRMPGSNHHGDLSSPDYAGPGRRFHPARRHRHQARTQRLGGPAENNCAPFNSATVKPLLAAAEAMRRGHTSAQV